MKWLAKRAAEFGSRGQNTSSRFEKYVGYGFFAAVLFVFLASSGVPQLLAQTFQLVGAVILNHISVGGIPPTVTGGTLANGSTDAAGQVTGLASGSPVVTFGTAYNVKPFCVFSSVAEAEGLGVTYTSTAITFTNLVNGAVATYSCFGTVNN